MLGLAEQQLDFDRLSLLPDTVKRKILSSLDPGQAPAVRCTAGAAQQQFCRSTGTSTAKCSDTPRYWSDISGRCVLLPHLGSAGACIVDGVLSSTEAVAVARAVENRLAGHGRSPGMGSFLSGGLWHNTNHRGDITNWVTEQELQAAGQLLLASVIQLMNSLRPQLTQQGFDVSGRCSVQLACYPGAGARYVRHADASTAIPDRTVTALLYLNTEWNTEEDGGQLVLYNAAHSRIDGPAAETADASVLQAAAGYLGGEPAMLVAPLAGRLLVFDSKYEHEVLPAQRHRYSITVFFYKRETHTSESSATAATSSAAATPPDTIIEDATEPCVQLQSETAAAVPPGPQLPSRAGDSLPVLPATQPSAPAALQQCAPPRIFVSIPAFRDKECQWTLRDMFLKATYPERVYVGVVWQIDPVEDHDFVRIAGRAATQRYLKQIREVRLHYQTATGPCAARSLAQQLWQGEEYAMQIDAHMRFVEGWDGLCLQQLHLAQQAASQERVVLSTYPLGYCGDGAAAAIPDNASATLLCATGFNEDGLLRIQGRCLREKPAGPLPSLFWAAGFSFAPAAWLLEVPYCPHLPHLFFGEESYMLARMVTRGWQVWAPNQPVVFHQWERSTRAKHYQACVKIDAMQRRASQSQVLKVLHSTALLASVQSGVDSNDSRVKPVLQTFAHAWKQPSDADWAPGGVWGLGIALSLQQCEAKLGINFSDTNVSLTALYGGQPAEVFL